MRKITRIYLYTDDIRIIDAVFAYTLKKNIVECGSIELFRRREHDILNSILQYDLVIIDDSISEKELAEVGEKSLLPFIFRVIRNQKSLDNKRHDKSQDLEFDKLISSIHGYLNDMAS